MATHQWILLQLLCGLLLLVAKADDTRIESLIAIKQTDDGVELSIFPKYFGTKSSASDPVHSKTVPDHQLSMDCGDEYFRCKPLPVATQNTSNETAYQLLLPLSGGLLVMELNFQPVNNSNMVFGAFQILNTGDCSPTTIFKLYDSHYTMCTNLQNKLVSLYEIRVNKSSIERTEISGPLVTVEQLADFMDASDVVNMSNFLLSTDDPNIPYIYFAVDNFLFAITPLDYSVDFNFLQVGTTRCRYIHRLVRVSNTQMLAYCSSEFVYFDTEHEDWVSEHSYTGSGVPYICPNEMYGISAFHDYLEYSIGQKKGTLSHVNVGSGVCFSGTGGQNYFVYNDKVTDTTSLMNLASPSQTQMQLCEGTGCLPVIAVEDPIRYLIVRQPLSDGQVNVLDVGANFSKIISANNREESDMFTIVHVKTPLYPYPSELPPRKKTQVIIPLIAGIIGGGLAIAALITVLIIVAIVLGYRIVTHKRITKQTVPLPESQPTCVISNQHAFGFQAPHPGQPFHQDEAKPCPVSPSGDAANSMPAGGNSNSSLGQLGEEEEMLRREKKLNEDVQMPDNEKMADPGVTLHDSTSLATASLSFDPEAITASDPIAATAADSDTGSEDSRMNSDREPLLENSS